MTKDLKQLYRLIDHLSRHGDPAEQELMVTLIHDIDDYVGRSDKPRDGSTKGLHDTRSATST